MDMYTLLYLEWITNKDLLCGTWNLAQCYVVAWMGGVLGREWMCVCVYIYTHTYIYIYTHTHTHIYMAESFPCSLETTTIQSKKLLKIH